MLILNSSLGSFETAALNLSYSSHSLAPLRSNERLLHSKSNLDILEGEAQTKPIFTHKRIVSNPFDIIYNSDKDKKRYSKSSSEDKRLSGISFKTPTIPNTPKMPPTPHNLYNPGQTYSTGNSHSRVISDIPPAVTLIENDLSRSGSVISRSSSIRNRYNIVKRNKMINKKSLDVQTPSFDTQSNFSTSHYKDKYGSEYGGDTKDKGKNKFRRLRFLFPVKRQTSLKKNSTYRLLKELKNRKSKFHSKEELEEFLRNCNSTKIMKELLPNKMKIFDYSNLITRKPILKKTSRTFHIDESNIFTIVSPEMKKLNISAPFPSTLTKNNYTYNPFPAYDSKRQSKEFNLLDSIYNKYRGKAFQSGTKIPPKFTDYFPDELDSSLVTPFDIDNFNKKLLFEILLRRTLAAKIGYRLEQNGYTGSSSKRNKNKTGSKDSDEDASNESSSDDSDDSNPQIRHSHIPELVHTDSDDDDSVHTDDINQNESLYSGLLPSPQFSYKSDMFGDFEFKSEGFKGSEGDLSSKHLKSENKLRRTASTNDLLNLVKHVTPRTPLESTFPTHSNSNSPFVRSYNPSSHHGISRKNSTAFGSEANRSFFQKRDDELAMLENSTRPTNNVFELKPLNRSVETFSSSESDRLSRTPPLELSRNHSLRSNTSTLLNNRRRSVEAFDNISNGSSINLLALGGSKLNNSNSKINESDRSYDDRKRDSNVTGTSGSSENFDNSHRKSHSTTNTSIFQDLDELSSQLSTYIKDPKTEQKFIHKNILTEDDPLYNLQSKNHQQQHQIGQQDLEQVNLSNQNILETIKLSTSSLERLNYSSKNNAINLNEPQDIKSMKASISVVGSDTTASQSYYKPQLTNTNLEAINESESSNSPPNDKIIRREDSLSTRTITTFGKKTTNSQYSNY